MKKIAYLVALGLLTASVQASDNNGKALFPIASDALPVVEKPASNTVKLKSAPAAKTAQAKDAPLFNVSNATRDAAQDDKKTLVVQKKADARPAAKKAKPADKPAKAEAKPERLALKAAESKPQAKPAEPAVASSADVKTETETSLFKIASYYEADEMGDSDDAVRKIDFSKPVGQQLPGQQASGKAASKATLNAETRVKAEHAITNSKAIALAAPEKPRKQRKGSYSYVVRGKRYQTLASSENFVEEGAASWYGPGFHGRKTASGEVYDMHMLTAAHKELPLGTKLEVTSKRTGKTVVVTVNDRGPFHGNRILDLSHAAAKQLGIVHSGVGQVTIRAIK